MTFYCSRVDRKLNARIIYLCDNNSLLIQEAVKKFSLNRNKPKVNFC